MYNKLKKGFVVIIICFFLLVTIPTVNSEWIRFPKSEGPYNVIVGGSPQSVEGMTYFTQNNPFWNLEFNETIGFSFLLPMIFINGEFLSLTPYCSVIRFYGFKGYCPGGLPFRTIFYGRIRIIGQCEELLIIDDS